MRLFGGELGLYRRKKRTKKRRRKEKERKEGRRKKDDYYTKESRKNEVKYALRTQTGSKLKTFFYRTIMSNISS